MLKRVMFLFLITPFFANAKTNNTNSIESLNAEEKYTFSQEICNGALDFVAVGGAGLTVMSGVVIVILAFPEVIYEIADPNGYDAVTDDFIVLRLEEANNILVDSTGMDSRCIEAVSKQLESYRR